VSDAHLRRADLVLVALIDDFGGPLPAEPDTRGRPDELYRTRACLYLWRSLADVPD
jgi:hypothetical protein